MRSVLRRWMPLVVLVGVCVIAGIIDPFRDPTSRGFKIGWKARVRVDITAIDSALWEYAYDHGGVYPTTLAALVEPDEQGYRYLNCSRPPLDPWKRDYIYTPPSPTNPRPIVTSLGRDGAVGGDDDDLDVDTLTIAAEVGAKSDSR